MDKITNFSVSPLIEKSKFVNPFRIEFERGGKLRLWDGIRSHDSVSILIYNRDKRSFVFVKQFRPVIFYSALRKKSGQDITNVAGVPCTPLDASGQPIDLPIEAGETLELCAGIVDKSGASLEVIAAEEVFEECGYQVDPNRLQKITTVAGSVGLGGTYSSVFYVEVTDADCVKNAGGGNLLEGEAIEVVYWPIDKAEDLLFLTEKGPPVSTPCVLAVLWFNQHIRPNLPLTA